MRIKSKYAFDPVKKAKRFLKKNPHPDVKTPGKWCVKNLHSVGLDDWEKIVDDLFLISIKGYRPDSIAAKSWKVETFKHIETFEYNYLSAALTLEHLINEKTYTIKDFRIAIELIYDNLGPVDLPELEFHPNGPTEPDYEMD